MIVKAKAKPVSMWPAYVRCCDEQIKNSARSGEDAGIFEVDLKDVQPTSSNRCGYCGAEYPTNVRTVAVKSGPFAGRRIRFDYIDIDEGGRA